MKNWGLARILFWGATFAALLLFALTAPDGLPWGVFPRTHPVWRHFIGMFAGNAVALASVAVALAAGLVAALSFRFFGWRVAIGAALTWMFAPGVWNRAITGDWKAGLMATGVFVLWGTVQAGRLVLRRLKIVLPDRWTGDRWQKWNRYAGWTTMGAGILFALVSLTLHDYRLGEAASAYARGVVEEAGERVIVLNGLCDGQVVDAAHRSSDLLRKQPSAGGYSPRQNKEGATFVGRGEGAASTAARGEGAPRIAPAAQLASLGGYASTRVISLRNDAAYRTNLVAWTEFAFPGETNLWLLAHVSAEAFVEAAAKTHPDRFYLMNGTSTTRGGWEVRWEAFQPYLSSSDPFVPVARRVFAYEGNVVANALLELKCEVEVEERNLTSGAASPLNGAAGVRALPQHNKKADVRSSTPTQNFNSAAAWQLYKRIYEEIDPGNISALVNMSEMIRRGYAVPGDERRRLQEALDRFFKDAHKRNHLHEIVRASGPIRTDPVLRAKIEAVAMKSKDTSVTPEILSFVEWSNAMVEAMDRGEVEKAGRLARAILSNERWRDYVPANAVLGAVSAAEGDYAASESFFVRATNTTDQVPAATLNDYADTLLRLGKFDEAEKTARRAVETSDEKFWLARLTLSEVLVEKAKRDGAAEGLRDEIRTLLRSVMVRCPASVREKVRLKVDRIRQEAGR